MQISQANLIDNIIEQMFNLVLKYIYRYLNNFFFFLQIES